MHQMSYESDKCKLLATIKETYEIAQDVTHEELKIGIIDTHMKNF